ncbi:hypothetical protein [Amedibacillus sp. YH-ame10]
MSDECAFYKYDRGYYCIKAKKNVNDDIVHKYCWGYHYNDCPIYKDEDTSSSSCYITTACVTNRNMADNCEIMMNLRAFRDGYMSENHNEDIRKYYQIAPSIVSNINLLPNSKVIWDKVYDDMIAPCNDLIIAGKEKSAYELYKEKALVLEQKYNK